LGILSVLIFAFYLLLARDKLDDQLLHIFGEKNKTKFGKTLDLLEKKLGGWARGELALMFLVGSLNFIGLTLLRIPFALPLSLLAGSLEIIPSIGPVVAAIPAIVIGFGISPYMGFAVVALAFLIQQVENYVFVPKVMEKSVGVSPVITLLALAIGFKLVGVIGK
jgi:predicted PurR-regulated permease PerM